jgi:hypothetical protein
VRAGAGAPAELRLHAPGGVGQCLQRRPELGRPPRCALAPDARRCARRSASARGTPSRAACRRARSERPAPRPAPSCAPVRLPGVAQRPGCWPAPHRRRRLSPAARRRRRRRHAARAAAYASKLRDEAFAEKQRLAAEKKLSFNQKAGCAGWLAGWLAGQAVVLGTARCAACWWRLHAATHTQGLPGRPPAPSADAACDPPCPLPPCLPCRRRRSATRGRCRAAPTTWRRRSGWRGSSTSTRALIDERCCGLGCLWGRPPGAKHGSLARSAFAGVAQRMCGGGRRCRSIKLPVAGGESQSNRGDCPRALGLNEWRVPCWRLLQGGSQVCCQAVPRAAGISRSRRRLRGLQRKR